MGYFLRGNAVQPVVRNRPWTAAFAISFEP
jgi:hypothetical protein